MLEWAISIALWWAIFAAGFVAGTAWRAMFERLQAEDDAWIADLERAQKAKTEKEVA
jgi:hypothetical protein